MRKMILITILAVSFMACENLSTPSIPDSDRYNLSTFGKNILDSAGTLEWGNKIVQYGTDCLVVYSKSKFQLIKYNINTGFDRILAQDVQGLVGSETGIYYYSFGKIYELKEDGSSAVIEETEISFYWNDQTVLNDNLFATIAASENSGIPSVNIEVFDRNTKIKSSMEININDKINSINYSIIYNSNIYFYAYTNNGKYLYKVDLLANMVISKQKIENMMNVLSIFIKDDKIHFIGLSNIYSAPIFINGDIDLDNRESMDIHPHYSVDSAFVSDTNKIYMVAEKHGLSGIYEFDPNQISYNPVYEPIIGENTLYRTWSIYSNGNELYIGTGNRVNKYLNLVYQESYLLANDDYSYHHSNMAVNRDGLLVVTHNSSTISVIDDSVLNFIIPDNETFPYLYGITETGSGKFLLRDRGGISKYIREFDPETGKATVLFKLSEGESTHEDDIEILPNGNILLHDDNSISVYDKEGHILRKSDSIYETVDFDRQIASIEYSKIHNAIFALSTRGVLHRFDLENLTLHESINISEVQGQTTGLSIDDNGRIYIMSHNNCIYIVDLK